MSEEKPGLLAGFRDFLMRGNVVELAVAVVVGTAFSKIVTAVVNGFINPLVGAIGTKSLDDYQSCLRGPCEVDPATGEVISGVPISWGSVVGATITFLITAAVVYFLMILPMNRYRERQAARNPVEETTEPTEVELLTEIRDALLAQRAGSPSVTGSEGCAGSSEDAGSSDGEESAPPSEGEGTVRLATQRTGEGKA
ncbi:large conductance mechanosensitive channel protein MscL [Streptomyces oceani]|uniref:large conductance mechanosensitive channel protein MscL n=1 Tax=Streptomyces oceani TaxID=1075402 RepID=UPI0008734989|nr:large conductance mechanosensitive channel protein MscL [Streptomyces oceani]